MSGTREPMNKEANPRRVAGQLRAMIRRRMRNLWWICLLPILPLIAIVACIYYSASGWLVVLFSIATISGVIHLIADVNQLFTWKARLAAVEAQGELEDEE